jgi:dUTP pyrophosphatase
MDFNQVMTTEIKMKKLFADTKVPTYGTVCSAGADLYAVLDTPVTIAPHDTKVIPTGVAFEIPVGLVGVVCARSGLSCKQDLAPANKVGIIDADYRGEVVVVLHNHGTQVRTVKSGDRVAQILFMPYVQAKFSVVDKLSDTVRGVGGFGHTGV